jgi:hypothetical protein
MSDGRTCLDHGQPRHDDTDETCREGPNASTSKDDTVKLRDATPKER